MSETTKRLVFSILKFLEEQKLSGTVGEDGVESLEVAVQCLESVYGVSVHDSASCTVYDVGDSLLNIFNMATPKMEPKVHSNFVKKEPTPSEKEEADNSKSQGNEYMKLEQFAKAVECYSRALELDNANAVYYCNRAAAYSKLNEHAKALSDCELALEIDPTYSKAYGRKGLAHTALNQHNEARLCYIKALELDPGNESYRNNLEIAEQQSRDAPPMPPGLGGLGLGGMDFSSVLGNPALMNMATQLMSNPQMQQMMAGIMGGGAGAGPEESQAMPDISNLLQAGQQLAQQMQQTNPELVDQLRQQMGNQPPQPPDAQ